MAVNRYISIHAPREGSDGALNLGAVSIRVFLSTLPARGATEEAAELAQAALFLSTLPAGGATYGPCCLRKAREISIHAPREGSDTGGLSLIGVILSFLSTLPARGATEKTMAAEPGTAISIHAPREGSDLRIGF